MTTVYYEYDPDDDDNNNGNEPHKLGHLNPLPGTEKLIVYGADWCGWTRKQKEFLDNHRIRFEYIDCAQNDSRCSVAKGFPTLQYGSTIRSGAMLSKDKLNSELGMSI